MMLMASMTMLTGCSTDSSEDDFNNWYNNGGGNGENGPGGASAGSGDLLTFDVSLDKTSAEPTSDAAAYYPEAEDDVTTQTFATEVEIDMANPVAKTENGVTITISGDSVIANHGKQEGVCYVVSGTTSDGMLYIDGKTNFMLNLNGADITCTKGTALDIQSKMAAYIVLTGQNKLTDGTTEDHKSVLYGKGKLLLSGTG